MSDRRRTVNIVCAKAPRRIGCVPAVREVVPAGYSPYGSIRWESGLTAWRCAWCGARVKVVA